MKQNLSLNYNVDIQSVRNKIEEFKVFIIKQKQHLLLDKNQLYVKSFIA